MVLEMSTVTVGEDYFSSAFENEETTTEPEEESIGEEPTNEVAQEDPPEFREGDQYEL